MLLNFNLYIFTCAATLHVIIFFFCGMSHTVQTQTHKVTIPHTHKPDQTKININGFDMAKSAAQLLYGPVLVSVTDIYSFARRLWKAQHTAASGGLRKLFESLFWNL